MGVARRSVAGLVIGAALALSGCGGDGAAVQGVGDGAGAGGAEQARPSDLVGAWGIADADVDANAVLAIVPEGIVLYRDCGSIDGGWDASLSGLFLAEVGSGSGDCFPEEATELTPTWLLSATGFRGDGERVALIDGSGAVTATLMPGLPDAVPDGFAEEWEELSNPDPAAVAALDVDPEALPAGLTPATQEQILGRWDPADAPNPKREKAPHLEFQDGEWSASDGCNGSGGRWTIDAGALVSTGPGGSTDIGCENRNVAGWFGEAARAGFDGGELVLVDRDGEETGRLVSSTKF